MATRKKRKVSRKKGRNTKKTSFWRRLFWKTMLWGFVIAIVGLGILDLMIRDKFEGRKWALPAHVYSRSLDLYEGLALTPSQLAWELDELGYRQSSQPRQPGQYRISGDHVELYSRGFRFWDGEEPARFLDLRFDDGLLERLDSNDGRVAVARLEPVRIGGIFPTHLEDRELVKLEELPPYLVDGLLAVEDRRFYEHHGVSLRGIARAMKANLQSGSMRQGGSTVTQQLVKNFYLTQDRTLVRKLMEIPMALLLELHYSKSEILETYFNEVFLGQAGRRAIHGFALASRHYFRQPVQELELHQVALLVGLVKGASYYDPWSHPERAKQRRDLVLDVMAEVGMISGDQARGAKLKRLGVVSERATAFNRYPAYLDLVKRQLQQDYSAEDLRSEGLRIFTSFDPQVQWQLERSISNRLANLEQGYRMEKDKLEAGAVVTRVGSGKVVALAGGRQPGFAGFNRALDAIRPVGSTIKPAVFLTALEKQRYTLSSLISDTEFSITAQDGQVWQPKNYGREEHGDVPLYEALGQSYNLATARLGMELGVPTVVDTLERLGLEREVNPVPSLLLGATGMSPYEIAGIYHTIAADGFYTRLSAIDAVYTADNEPLRRYAHEVEQRFSAESMHLLQYGLQVVVREGTGKNAYSRLPQEMVVAGKTGTSNDQRDSWFAGFSGNYLSVVWLGMDDNSSMPLTGGTGALRVWTDLMAGIDNESMAFRKPQEVSYLWVDAQNRLSGEDCKDARYLPFINGTEPTEKGPCYEEPRKSVVDWFKDLWGN
ncbi:penicillin-binding protein 1B [Porticoccaceae bacterium LTM1]|nr:penicillin-binding protein 1B [Porticoccaceae bacterium LTM1]